MADSGGLAIAILTILGFAGFALWAKTPRGRQTMQEAFGAPDGGVKKPPLTRKRSAASRPKASPAKPPAAKSETKTAARPVRKPRS